MTMSGNWSLMETSVSEAPRRSSGRTTVVLSLIEFVRLARLLLQLAISELHATVGVPGSRRSAVGVVSGIASNTWMAGALVTLVGSGDVASGDVVSSAGGDSHRRSLGVVGIEEFVTGASDTTFASTTGLRSFCRSLSCFVGSSTCRQERAAE